MQYTTCSTQHAQNATKTRSPQYLARWYIGVVHQLVVHLCHTRGQALCKERVLENLLYGVSFTRVLDEHVFDEIFCCIPHLDVWEELVVDCSNTLWGG